MGECCPASQDNLKSFISDSFIYAVPGSNGTEGDQRVFLRISATTIGTKNLESPDPFLAVNILLSIYYVSRRLILWASVQYDLYV